MAPTLLRQRVSVKPRRLAVAWSIVGAMPPSLESASRINLRWIVRLRWGAVVGQVVTILFASRMLHEALPVKALLVVCAALALLNLATQLWLRKGGNPTERTCGLNLLLDVLALTVLLALLGLRLLPYPAGLVVPCLLLFACFVPFARHALLVAWVLGLIVVADARTTLNGLTGCLGSGTRGSGFSSGIDAGVPSFSRKSPTVPANSGAVSICSKDDQIHCGRDAVFCTIWRPISPTVCGAQEPVSGSRTMAVRL